MTIKALDTYFDLCTQVYDLSKPLPPEDAYRFYSHYVNQCSGLILEPMCGTGRFLLPLLAEGFDVHGFDASESMLNQLHKKAKHLALRPTIWHGFLQNLNRPEQYGLIFIPTGSFGLITDLDQAKASLKAIHHHLAADGVFVFEVENIQYPRPTPRVWRGDVWALPNGEYIVSSYMTLAPDSNQIETTVCKYELVKNHTIIKAECELLRVRLYESSAMKQLLQESGFQHIRLVKPFDHKEHGSEQNDLLIFECRKN
ncbi:MAG: class I SAM-dependent methyltransferase [Pseudomonadota bacterium]